MLRFPCRVSPSWCLTGNGIKNSIWMEHCQAGLKNIWKIKAIRISGMILAVYAIIFSTILFFCQIWLYTGIMHIAGNRKFYQLSDGFDSLFNIPEILSRLDVIGFPYLSLLFLISGLILLISGFRLLSVNRIRD